MPYVITDKILFLSEASKVLSSSLDYNVTLAIVANLLVNNISDFCMIDVFVGNTMERLVVKVHDPKKRDIAHRMFNFPLSNHNKKSVHAVAQTGMPVIVGTVTKKWLNSVSRIPEERKTIELLGLRSIMFVPLKSRGNVLGVMTIASSKEGFSYSYEDAILMEELSDRIGMSIDKALLYQEAQEALRTRDEFLSIASHELKTPLTSMLLNLQLILKRIYDTKTQTEEINEITKMVEVSVQQSRRMARLINDLLNVSVVSTGRLKIEKEKINLSDFIEEIIQSFSARLSKSNIKVIYNKPQAITGSLDKIRIEQVISNLLSNAIKYGNRKPISVELVKDGKKAVLKIKDHGIGVTKEDLPHIFGRFKRAVDPRDYTGLGVGLYISQQIIDAHKGRLSVESRKGKGSVFIIELPL